MENSFNNENHLTMKINFILSKDGGESQPMHSSSDNTIIMIDNNTNEIINELFSSRFTKYQIGLRVVILSLIVLMVRIMS